MVGVKGLPLPAGIDQVVEQIGVRLVQRGHKVTAFVRPHYTSIEQKEYKGIQLVHVPSFRTRSLDALTSSIFATARAIAMKPDIVHIHSQGLSIFAPFPRMFGIKTIVQSHGLDWQRAKWNGLASRMIKFTDYTTVNWPNATVVVSRKLQNYYESKYKKKVHYIPNGSPEVLTMAPDNIQKWGLNNKDYLLFAARLVPEKWCHGLINAYKRIENPRMPLVIAGDSEYGDPYGVALKKNAGNNIRFLGFVTGTMMQELYANAYAYVLPSTIEGLSTGLLEAMSYGNCVLVSDIEENKEAISGCGLTFKSGDEKYLQEKLEYLLGHPEMLDTFRDKARQRVREEYNWETITDEFIDLYTELQN